MCCRAAEAFVSWLEDAVSFFRWTQVICWTHEKYENDFDQK